ncbi:MAG TPA: hypothetical protein VFT30_12085, partial [Nitrospira sp.]|nr:hypothetical protein [Nitrospira sp.]
PYWIGGAAGLGPSMGTGQTYAAIIIEATGYGHRNVFKHEWGHSILFYFDAMGLTPKPAVTNHAEVNQYVHWPTGDGYVWIDETDANPIPNSIYNNESGFTHDYYSGTTATADQPERRLGITPEAWMLGGPVTKPGTSSVPPPVITCNADITVTSDPGTCQAIVKLIPPAVSDACDSSLTPVATRSDGADPWAVYPCGQTVVTWTVTNSANLTSTCEQVITVTDGKPPAFVHVPPPVTVTTGPDATSCGVVVDETRLGSTSVSNPTVPDPTGDVYNPSSSLQNDIISTAATFDSDSITFTVQFADQIFPASSSNPRRLGGTIDIDTDQNSATGWHPLVGPPALSLGIEFQINLWGERQHPGRVEVQTRFPDDDTFLGTVPIQFTGNSFSV